MEEQEDPEEEATLGWTHMPWFTLSGLIRRWDDDDNRILKSFFLNLILFYLSFFTLSLFLFASPYRYPFSFLDSVSLLAVCFGFKWDCFANAFHSFQVPAILT